jgi:hypothetical protein
MRPASSSTAEPTEAGAAACTPYMSKALPAQRLNIELTVQLVNGCQIEEIRDEPAELGPGCFHTWPRGTLTIRPLPGALPAVLLGGGSWPSTALTSVGIPPNATRPPTSPTGQRPMPTTTHLTGFSAIRPIRDRAHSPTRTRGNRPDLVLTSTEQLSQFLPALINLRSSPACRRTQNEPTLKRADLKAG